MKTEDDTQVRDSFVPRFIWFIFSPETKKWLTKLIASRPLKTLLGRRRFHRSASLFLFSSVLLICCFGAIEHAHMHSCGASSGAGGIGCSLISLSAREEVRLRNAFPSPAFSGNQPTQRLIKPSTNQCKMHGKTHVQMRWTQHAIVRCEDSPNMHSKSNDTTNKKLEQMLRMHSKNARTMSVPTTWATTHANDKQHETLKHMTK